MGPGLGHEEQDHAGTRQLLGFWRALELATPQSIVDQGWQSDGGVEGAQGDCPVLTVHGSTGCSVYLGCFTIQSAYDLLPDAAAHASRSQPSATGVHALGKVELDAGGNYRTGSFELSTAAWSIGRQLEGQGSLDLEAAKRECAKLADSLRRVAPGDLLQALLSLTDSLRQLLALRDLSELSGYRVIVVPQAHPVEAHQPAGARQGLNSPFTAGIAAVQKLEAAGGLPQALYAFLGERTPVVRLDVESSDAEEIVAQALQPLGGSIATWPVSDRASKSETLCSNLILRELQADGGIQAVSLPEGGESYPIIRKVLVDQLVSKADALATLPRPQFAFTNRSSKDALRRADDPWLLIDELHAHGVMLAGGVEAALRSLPGKLSLRPSKFDPDPLLSNLQECLSTPWVLSKQFEADGQAASDRLTSLLEEAATAPLDPDERVEGWKDATGRYLAARDRVAGLLEETRPLSDGTRNYLRARRRLSALARTLDQAEAALADRLAQAEQLDAEAIRIQAEEQIAAGGRRGTGRVGGAMEAVLNLCAAICPSKAKPDDSEKVLADAQGLVTLKQQVERLRAEIAAEQAFLTETAKHADVLAAEAGELGDLNCNHCESMSAKHLSAWYQGQGLQHLDTELGPLWRVAGLREAQQDLVNEASRLAAVFVRLESRKLLANLQRGRELLAGGDPGRLSGKQVDSLVSTLLMFTPVEITTPREIGTRWKLLRPESIGWVVLTDAGHIPAQEAVGAVLMAKRVVSIGDSATQGVRSQLPGVMIEQLAGEARLPRTTRYQSAQELCERASPYGSVQVTEFGVRWTGLPVRVYPHGAEPMLSILTRLSRGYRLAVRRPNVLSVDPGSGWVDVPSGGRASWMPTERRALLTLLGELVKRGLQPEQIHVASPLPRVVVELQKVLAGTRFIPSSTAELRGRPADVVIVVLGGGQPGAREWVCADPSLMTAAVAGAMSGLYLIGDRAKWSCYPVMRPFAELLPPIDLAMPEVRPATQRGSTSQPAHPRSPSHRGARSPAAQHQQPTKTLFVP